MRGHRDRPQRWAGKHHDDIAGGNAAALGDELGLAGMLEADSVQLFLRNWTSHHRGRRAGAGQTDGQLQRIERAVRARDTRMAGNITRGGGKLDQRQRIIEGPVRLAWIVDHLDRAIPYRRDRPAVADCHERRQIELGAVIPALGDHFGTDPGRVTERDCEWRIRGAWHSRGP